MMLRIFWLFVLLVVAGCSGGDDDVRSWVVEQQKAAKPKVDPFVPPKDFTPQAYEGASGTEPFHPVKLTNGANAASEKANTLLQAERVRPREALEEYALDSVAMVGSVRKVNGFYAILRVDGLLYSVAVGNHVGKNFGKIISVTETDMTLREIVRDAVGEWVERVVKLQLQATGQ